MRATKLQYPAVSYSSMFEQPGFLKHCLVTPHIPADGKQRWLALCKISHLYSGAAEQHNNNYAAAQITECTKAFQVLIPVMLEERKLKLYVQYKFQPG